MTSDIVFLLIFVILPTALIVSGFWLVLFIRREPEIRVVERRPRPRRRVRREPEVTARPGPEEVTEIAAIQEIAGKGENEQRARASELDHEAVEELSPLAADLLYGQGARVEENEIDDARLLELLDPGDRDLMEERIAGGDQEPDRIERTEEIPEVSREGAGSEPAGRDAEWRRPAEAPEGDEPGDAALGEPAPGTNEREDEPRESDVEPDEGDDDNGVAGDQHQRQPRARLLPSGEAERRRGRTSGRRVPRIARLPRRDEGGVEGGDGPPDIPSGYGE